MNWMYEVDWQALAGFANAFAILGAAWLARRTFQSWQDERKAKREVEVAEEALALMYGVEERSR